MKNLLKLAICSAVFCPLISSAQSIDIINPDNTGLFHDYVTAMNSDVSALYVPTVYANFDFNYAGGGVGTFDVPSDGGGGITFMSVANPPSFTLNTGDMAKVGYFGNESWDLNSLWVKDDTLAMTQLFEYDIAGGAGATVGPPTSASLKLAANTASASFTFEHSNPIKGVTDQTNSARFKFFQAYDGQVALNTWVIGIDDRENDLVDFDDGFFLVSIVPVPEPSHIAGLAILGMGALLMVRRRIKARK